MCMSWFQQCPTLSCIDSSSYAQGAAQDRFVFPAGGPSRVPLTPPRGVVSLPHMRLTASSVCTWRFYKHVTTTQICMTVLAVDLGEGTWMMCGVAIRARA
jgi:hypothetical protein